MLAFLRWAVLPFRYARLTAYYLSTALCHPISLIIIAILVWRSYYTPHGHDAGGFLFTMIGYVGLIAMPARFVRNFTRPPPAERLPILPQEAKWPASAQVTIALPDILDNKSLSESEMWNKLDPLLHKISNRIT